MMMAGECKTNLVEEPRLLGTVENELGIRKWLEDQGHTLVTTSDKEGPNSTFEKELVDAEVIITTPYVTCPVPTETELIDPPQLPPRLSHCRAPCQGQELEALYHRRGWFGSC